jgi:hypothetical protein
MEFDAFISHAAVTELAKRLEDSRIILQRNEAELNLIVNERSSAQFEVFKTNELDRYKKIMQAPAYLINPSSHNYVNIYNNYITYPKKTVVLLLQTDEKSCPYITHLQLLVGNSGFQPGAVLLLRQA